MISFLHKIRTFVFDHFVWSVVVLLVLIVFLVGNNFNTNVVLEKSLAVPYLLPFPRLSPFNLAVGDEFVCTPLLESKVLALSEDRLFGDLKQGVNAIIRDLNNNSPGYDFKLVGKYSAQSLALRYITLAGSVPNNFQIIDESDDHIHAVSFDSNAFERMRIFTINKKTGSAVRISNEGTEFTSSVTEYFVCY